jgi:hypothetical protein
MFQMSPVSAIWHWADVLQAKPFMISKLAHHCKHVTNSLKLNVHFMCRRLGQAGRRFDVLVADGAAQQSVLVSAAKQVWNQFMGSSHHMAAYHPPLLAEVSLTTG